MRKLLLPLALVFGGVAHLAQRAADPVRHASGADTELLFLPSPTTFELATMGYHEPMASLLWVRAVLLFGEHHGNDPDPAWGDWLAGMIEAIAALDPSWRTPYHYGGTMLRSMGDIDGSDHIFGLGMESMPDDAFFPFAIGMNHYLHRDDPVAAVEWINLAASKPEAPDWYRIAAAGLLAKEDMIPVALRFLEEQRASTTDPTILEMIDMRIERLRHDALVEAFIRARVRYREQVGADIERPEDLERLGQTLPPVPGGGTWIIGADGLVRSEAREQENAERARAKERAMLLRP